MKTILMLCCLVGVTSGLWAQRQAAPPGKQGEAQVFLQTSQQLPARQPFELAETYPNPVTGVIHVEFDILFAGTYVIAAVGPYGREITRLAEQSYQPGHYQFDWMVEPGTHGLYMFYLDDQGQSHFHRLLMIKY